MLTDSGVKNPLSPAVLSCVRVIYLFSQWTSEQPCIFIHEVETFSKIGRNKHMYHAIWTIDTNYYLDEGVE